MNLKNKYIKILNEEDFNRAIKLLEKNGFKGNSSYYGSTNYNIIKKVLGNTIDKHTILLFDNNTFESANHLYFNEEFIIPKEKSLKDKLTELFEDPTIAIKINSKEELKRYCKVMLTLGGFYWKSGATYEIDEPPGVIADINKKGFKLLAPYDGGNAYIRDNTKLIEFKDLLKHINYE